jgi:orotidine-5'-phosphate decarboxylase
LEAPCLVVALDQLTSKEAIEAASVLQGRGVRWFKVGLELYTLGGPRLVEDLKARGLSVFLDLKFHDIPNTVSQAVKAAASLGVDLVTVHTLGGRVMLDAALKATLGTTTRVVGVTVLTSLSDLDVSDLAQAWAGSRAAPMRRSDTAYALAQMAIDAGLHGIVCSVPDLQSGKLRALAESSRVGRGLENFIFVTPGIRAKAPARTGEDQKAIATPEAAVACGSTHLVVGRPILRPTNGTIAEAAEAFLRAIQLAQH